MFQVNLLTFQFRAKPNVVLPFEEKELSKLRPTPVLFYEVDAVDPKDLVNLRKFCC